MLPESDDELDEWIATAVRENDRTGFFYVLLAAVCRERRVDSRHLTHGVPMISHSSWIGIIAWKTHGEVAEHLLDALQNHRLTDVMRGETLLAATLWCRKYREGVVPPRLLVEARTLTRKPKLNEDTRVRLLAVACLLKDEGLTRTVEQTQQIPLAKVQAESDALALATMEIWEGAAVDSAPETPRPRIASGLTVRRAVERMSRNDPCPCGSGQKYKRCCFEKDQERLRHSSDIAGKTLEEVQESPEPYLTEARLMKFLGPELARLDPLKINRALLKYYFTMLAIHRQYGRAAEAFELLGYADDLEEIWSDVIYHATVAGNREHIRRLARWHPENGKSDDHLYTATAIVLLEEDPAQMFKTTVEHLKKAIDDQDPECMVGLSRALMLTEFRIFGIYVARSMIPLLPKKEALKLLNYIFETRDAMNLPPDEYYSDVLDKRFAEEEPEEGKDSGELRTARRQLETKVAEARRIKEELGKLRREMSDREKKQAETIAASPRQTAPADDPRLQELRGKVGELKSILNERQEERASLRKDIQQAQAALETLRATTPAGGKTVAVDPEEALVLPGEVTGNQPVRILEFPRKFHETLGRLPRQVARGAMAMLGRLAAGEPAAFVGVVQLKDCPNTLRQRIGIDHRLLFRLHADRVEVVDLINRRDLEKRIKTL